LNFQPPTTGDPWGKKQPALRKAPSIHPCSFKFLPRIRGWMKIGSFKLHGPLKGAFIVCAFFVGKKNIDFSKKKHVELNPNKCRVKIEFKESGESWFSDMFWYFFKYLNIRFYLAQRIVFDPPFFWPLKP